MTGLGGLVAGFFALTFDPPGVRVWGKPAPSRPGHALIARKIVPERRGLALGLYSMGIPLGGMLGFTLGGAIGK